MRLADQQDILGTCRQIGLVALDQLWDGEDVPAECVGEEVSLQLAADCADPDKLEA